jgi:putative phosphonate metabolism protein
MSKHPRYAIYYAPAPDSDLDRFGSRLLGYDAYSGATLPFPESMTLAVPDWLEQTQDPRKYGFHATLKAPLSLAPDKIEAELLAACEVFAATARPIPVFKPIVGLISGFIAVVPEKPPDTLYALAADCVRAFDGFRAPLTTEDRSRRNPSWLTQRQLAHLDRWGYPHVMEDFQFHMTLTGRLAADRQATILPILRSRFAEIKLAALSVDSIALFRQDSADARFRIVRRYALNGHGAG